MGTIKETKKYFSQENCTYMEINHFFLTMEGKSLNVSKSKSVKAESNTFKHCKNKKMYPMKRELKFLESQT